jgi:hypothetical protein
MENYFGAIILVAAFVGAFFLFRKRGGPGKSPRPGRDYDESQR